MSLKAFKECPSCWMGNRVDLTRAEGSGSNWRWTWYSMWRRACRVSERFVSGDA